MKRWNAALVIFAAIALTSCTTGASHNPFPDVTPIEAITANSGTPQSHGITGAFAAPLIALVTSNGMPASGVTVTFTAPTTGASGTFADTGKSTATATSDSNGRATSAVFTANGSVGSYSVIASIAGVSTPATFSLINTTGAPATVSATGGNSQSTAINSAFSSPLTATVVDAGGNPVGNAIVVFTAPATGASGTFADTGTNSTNASTNASGIATSSVFTANSVAGPDIVAAAVPGATAPAQFALSNLAGAPAAISIEAGTSQSVDANTVFPTPLAVLVVDNLQNPVAGALVTFVAPATGAGGTFADTGGNTTTATTGINGVATAAAFTANANAGTFAVTASASGVSSGVNYTLTNWPAGSKLYSFYLTGQEAFNGFPEFYSLAGSVVIDPTGNVVAGEQDYNDGAGFTSPEPSGDSITGGILKGTSNTIQRTLILNTNNTSIGVSGVETFAVQFVNSDHGLIIQFDGSATSSGSIDLQTVPSTLAGGYAFTLTGFDVFAQPVAYGGVFSIDGNTLQSGLVDTNDAGTVITAAALTGAATSVDSFGRGTLSTSLNYFGLPISLNYYVVTPEALRIIDVDTTDSAIGSAFGQGANATTASPASLGSSIFGIQGNSLGTTTYGAAGMFSTDASAGTFSGVADDNEIFFGILAPDATISGSYSIASNGYGSFTITPGALGDISVFGIYATDPALNLLDPNNTSSGLGGALLLDLDDLLPGGTGFAVSQTDTSTADFAGSYAFGGQGQNFAFGPVEFDFVGEAPVTSGTLAGGADLSDPFLTFGAKPANTGVIFNGTPLPDPSNAGRYTLLSTNSTPNPLQVTLKGGIVEDFDVVVYQASGTELFWLNEDSSTEFFGPMLQLGSFSGLPSSQARSKAK